jgi:membrane-bound serine protease (ClpP class)
MAGLLLLVSGPRAVAASDPASESAPEQARQSPDEPDNQIRIVEVSGLLDPVLHDFILRELTAAEEAGVLGVLLQYDSHGSVLNQADFVELATRLQQSPVQIAIWVGPSGSAALGGSAELLGTADLVGVAVGSRIGETGLLRLPISDFPAPFGEASERLETVSISAPEAIELGITSLPPESTCAEIECSLEEVSVLRQFLTQFDGYQSPAETDDPNALTQPRFVQLPLSSQLFHTVASPEVAYLMFVGGLALLVFELFTAGVGVAGSIGAFMLIFGSYGLSVLPSRPLAIALLIGSMIAFGVDIQTNVPRLYSAIGMLMFTAGTVFLYNGYRMSWLTAVVGVVGAGLYAYTGMPSMVRTRFSSPTIGRSWMIGEMGEAVTDVAPEGTIRIKDAPWRALTNRATPVKAGDSVRVVGIRRMILEVEPEAGGARDYRERG